MELDLVKEINFISQLLSNHQNDIFAAIQCQLLSTGFQNNKHFLFSRIPLFSLSVPPLAIPLSSRKHPIKNLSIQFSILTTRVRMAFVCGDQKHMRKLRKTKIHGLLFSSSQFSMLINQWYFIQLEDKQSTSNEHWGKQFNLKSKQFGFGEWIALCDFSQFKLYI